jgi:ArsR family transcriptional regulator
LSSKKLERLAAVAKALADPNRIEILRLIARQASPVCACDIVARFELSQPTISHHLKVMKEAGLLKSGRQGLWVFYSVDPAGAGLVEGFAALLERP